MTNTPTFRVVPNITQMEQMPFDIVLDFEVKDGILEGTIRFDKEMASVLTKLVETHGRIFVKTNWFSHDVLLITPKSASALKPSLTTLGLLDTIEQTLQNVEQTVEQNAAVNNNE